LTLSFKPAYYLIKLNKKMNPETRPNNPNDQVETPNVVPGNSVQPTVIAPSPGATPAPIDNSSATILANTAAPMSPAPESSVPSLNLSLPKDSKKVTLKKILLFVPLGWL
jgi:hypothetical protein